MAGHSQRLAVILKELNSYIFMSFIGSPAVRLLMLYQLTPRITVCDIGHWPYAPDQ